IGNSGDIVLSARVIDIGAGANLLAQADNGFAAGNITLTATGDVAATWQFLSVPGFNWRNATSTVAIGEGAHLSGKDIKAATIARAKKEGTRDRDFPFLTRAGVAGDVNGDGFVDMVAGNFTPDADAWKKETDYKVGDVVRATADSKYFFRATTAGKSGS